MLAAMERKILGIDPGTVRLGFGFVGGTAQRPEYLGSGVLIVSQRWPLLRRLTALQSELEGLIRQEKPQLLAMESSFHGKNAQAMLRLGEARGMVLGLAGRFQMEVVDYTPARIKKSLTGRGNARKESVARMVMASFDVVLQPRTDDETDALAVAICHLHQSKLASLLREIP
jgi:crossover junction endodeoxyribonuclease RuvC